MSTVLSVMF